MENFRLKRNQFGPRSIEEVKNDMRRVKYNNGDNPKDISSKPLDVRSKIDNLNRLRRRTWK